MNEKTLRAETVYTGKLFRVERLDIEMENGVRSVREIVRHPGSVCILALRPDGRFILVRQYRKAPEMELVEIIAGTRNLGEPAEDCARREVREESGYDVRRLESWGFLYPSPGFVDERIDIYFAELAAEPAGQMPDADEAIDTVALQAEDMDRLVRENGIRDAKTLAVWGMWRCRRDHAQQGV